MNYHDFDDNEGCCLKCTEAHPGCLCFDCKCTQCDDYAEGGYNASGEYGGYCLMSHICWKGYGECKETTCVIREDICKPVYEWIFLRKQEQAFGDFWRNCV